jgi:hypothetical protein
MQVKDSEVFCRKGFSAPCPWSEANIQFAFRPINCAWDGKKWIFLTWVNTQPAKHP